MGKSAPSAQTVVNKTELPPFVTEAAQKNLAIADELAQRPYQPYGGSVVAGFSPEQQQAFQMAQQNVGSYQPALTAAMGAAAGGAYYNPQMVTAPSFLEGDVEGTFNRYLNPYLQTVEQGALEAGQRALDQRLNTISDSAIRGRAFGGSRQGIMEGVATAEAARQMGDLSAQIRARGYDQAINVMQADQARAMQAALANQQAGLAGAGLGLQGAGVLGNLAQQRQQFGLADVGAIGAVGEQQQALQQRQLEEAYARFIEQRDFPTQQLNLRLAALGATPYGQTTTQTKTGGESGSSLAAGLGGAGSFLAGLAAIGTF
jgi:hypothetical protein